MRLEDLLPKVEFFLPFGLYKTSSGYMKENYEHLGAEINEKREKSCKKLGITFELTRDFFTAILLYFEKVPPEIVASFYLLSSYVLDRSAYYGLPFNLRHKSFKNILKDK